MTSRSYFGKMNSILGSVVPLAMFLFVCWYIVSDTLPSFVIWALAEAEHLLRMCRNVLDFLKYLQLSLFCPIQNQLCACDIHLCNYLAILMIIVQIKYQSHHIDHKGGSSQQIVPYLWILSKSGPWRWTPFHRFRVFFPSSQSLAVKRLFA